ncbi:hypothetical protein B0J13DRAFT_680328 [Dactylonectria estremocensis]|uniref:Uncharacterized protein n=1 Tax=Dactylonectria estremocensis TaxID=1079267 RepID=A0A9P9DLZ4_9HYPO|nr:hypothetical protein B0J13DRAFT_680328 [Dactylonectria estremocensis]
MSIGVGQGRDYRRLYPVYYSDKLYDNFLRYGANPSAFSQVLDVMSKTMPNLTDDDYELDHTELDSIIEALDTSGYHNCQVALEVFKAARAGWDYPDGNDNYIELVNNCQMNHERIIETRNYERPKAIAEEPVQTARRFKKQRVESTLAAAKEPSDMDEFSSIGEPSGMDEPIEEPAHTARQTKKLRVLLPQKHTLFNETYSRQSEPSPAPRRRTTVHDRFESLAEKPPHRRRKRTAKEPAQTAKPIKKQRVESGPPAIGEPIEQPEQTTRQTKKRAPRPIINSSSDSSEEPDQTARRIKKQRAGSTPAARDKSSNMDVFPEGPTFPEWYLGPIEQRVHSPPAAREKSSGMDVFTEELIWEPDWSTETVSSGLEDSAVEESEDLIFYPIVEETTELDRPPESSRSKDFAVEESEDHSEDIIVDESAVESDCQSESTWNGFSPPATGPGNELSDGQLADVDDDAAAEETSPGDTSSNFLAGPSGRF